MLLKQLENIEAQARGSKIKRLLFSPLAYLFGTFFYKIIYPFNKKGVLRKVDTFFGSKMTLLLPAGMDIFILKAKTHDSEIRLTRFLIKTIKPGDTFVDIGAHFGFYSLLAAHLTGEEGKVFSVEASPLVYEILRQNIEQKPIIQAFHIAIAKKSGIIEFNEFPILYSEYNTIHLEQFEQSKWYKNNPPQKVKVQADKLESLLKKWNASPKVIKIDIEGAEYDAIAGLESFLQSNSTIIAMEYLAKGRENEAHKKALKIAAKYGLKPHLIDQLGNAVAVEDIDTALKNRGLDSDNIVLC